MILINNQSMINYVTVTYSWELDFSHHSCIFTNHNNFSLYIYIFIYQIFEEVRVIKTQCVKIDYNNDYIRVKKLICENL